MTFMTPIHAQRGTSLLEVLVTVVIISIGLLGLAGLQTRMQISEVESYQRSQALILLEDMASRIQTNRSKAANYVTGTGTPIGVGMICPTTTVASTRQQIDAAQWCTSLQGAAEVSGGNKAGAMIGGRGCVESPATNEYLVTVAWQGQSPVSAPPSSVACGKNLYDGAGTSCTGDLCRRAITTIVQIGTLN
jgi:type IV pilus assembly protein PilV